MNNLCDVVPCVYNVTMHIIRIPAAWCISPFAQYLPYATQYVFILFYSHPPLRTNQLHQPLFTLRTGAYTLLSIASQQRHIASKPLDQFCWFRHHFLIGQPLTLTSLTPTRPT